MAVQTVLYTEPASGVSTVFFNDGTGRLTQAVYLCDPASPATPVLAGNGFAASALRVTLASDSTGVVQLATGSNVIGLVNVNTVPADPFGVNADAASASGSISAKLRFIATTGIPVSQSGTFAVQSTETRPATCTTTEPDYTTINDTTRNITLLPSNANRRSVRIVNRNSYPIPIREGAVASPSSYSWLLPAQGEVVLEYPVCTASINGYFGILPDDRIFVTERT